MIGAKKEKRFPPNTRLEVIVQKIEELRPCPNCNAPLKKEEITRNGVDVIQYTCRKFKISGMRRTPVTCFVEYVEKEKQSI